MIEAAMLRPMSATSDGKFIANEHTPQKANIANNAGNILRIRRS